MCVYVGERKVVDLYLLSPNIVKGNQRVYDGDSTTCIFSSGKVVGAMMMAILRDKDLIDFDDKVAKHWPEFAQNGKDHITIADVLRHDSGLMKFNKQMTLKGSQTEGLK